MPIGVKIDGWKRTDAFLGQANFAQRNWYKHYAIGLMRF